VKLALELLAGDPLSAEVAVDLELGALVLDVALDALEGLNFLSTGEALDFESLALVLDMLLQLLEQNAELLLVGIAAVENLDLAKHLVEELVLNGLIQRSVDDVSGSLLLASATLGLVSKGGVGVLDDLAIVAALLRDGDSVLEGELELAEEADDLVAVGALLGLHRDLFAHHARTLFDELSLEFIHRHRRVFGQQDLDLKRRELALRED